MSKLVLKNKKEHGSQNTAKAITPVPNKQMVLRQKTAVPETAVDFNNMSPTQISHLQRTIGNQAIRRAVQRTVIQRKIIVGPVGDKYEQEADSVAKQVISTLHAPHIHNPQAETAQRQEEEEELQMKPLLLRQEEEEDLQMKPLPSISSLQRQEEEELQMKPIQRQEEEELQAKEDSMLAGGELSNDVENSVQSAKSEGKPLEDTVREPMEQAFNTDFSAVKVHTDGQSDNLNRSLSARAFTTGQDIFFRQGEYQPNNQTGQSLLAHELTHVVQQSSGSDHSSQRMSVKKDNQKLQRAPWANTPAKFKTDNEEDKIPNSEYSVTAGDYKRFASINKVRAPGQVYHEGPRSFVYLPDGENEDAAWDAITATPMVGKRVKLEDADGNEAIGHIDPQDGLGVWDADVEDTGQVAGGVHVGHEVEELGQPLPNLDDPQKIADISKQQFNIQVAQYMGALEGDNFYSQLFYALEENNDELKDGTPITPELAHKAMTDLANIKDNGVPPELAHKLMAQLAN